MNLNTEIKVVLLLICFCTNSAQAGEQSMIDFQRKNNSIQFGGKYKDKPWVMLPPYGKTKSISTGTWDGASSLTWQKQMNANREQTFRKKCEKLLEKISNVRNSMSENPEFQTLQPSDQYNINILMDNLQSEPIQSLSAADMSNRLLDAYKNNIEVHEQLRKLAKVKSQGSARI